MSRLAEQYAAMTIELEGMAERAAAIQTRLHGPSPKKPARDALMALARTAEAKAGRQFVQDFRGATTED